MSQLHRKILRPLEHALVTSMCEYIIRCNKHQFLVRPCFSKQDVLDTFALNYKRYLRRGYCQKNDSGLFFSKYNLNPCARTFLLDY